MKIIGVSLLMEDGSSVDYKKINRLDSIAISLNFYE